MHSKKGIIATKALRRSSGPSTRTWEWAMLPLLYPKMTLLQTLSLLVGWALRPLWPLWSGIMRRKIFP